MQRGAPPASPADTVDLALADTRAVGAGAAAVTTLPSPAEPPEGIVRASHAPPAAEDDEPRYAEGPVLGVGGMGEVRLHIDRRIGRPIARKTLRDDSRSADATARFLREARVQGQLEHPSVVPVYDLGTDEGGHPYFTMKRVRGETLSDILDRLAAGDAATAARFTRRKLLSAFVQVCLAVQYAHERGVLHRDLKPGNVMLGSHGEVYVLDWGIAKLMEDPALAETASEAAPAVAPAVTRVGALLGTPLYMSPEQLHARPEAPDVRADVFALGAILFEILTLQPYRKPGTLAGMMLEASKRSVELPSARASDVPPELDDLCARALAPDRAARLGSAAAVAEAVERYLEGDRDEEARRALAGKLAASAEGRLARGDAEGRVEAMREALKALALAPDDRDVQKLLLSLIVDSSSAALPRAAERELAEGDVETRKAGLRLGIWGYAAWLGAFPIALWAGVRSWSVIGALAGLTVVAILTARGLLRQRAYTTRQVVLLSSLTAAVIALTSALFGPFVLVPGAACAAAIMFVIHCSRAERPWLIGVWTVAVALPFGVELLGVVPPAYSFRPGEVVLHARAIDLPEGPILAALAYTSVSFLLLACVFVGRLCDRQRAAERRLFVQAWHLRQLFPAEAGPRT
jgi:serine/threonine-protein kinase